MILRIFSELSKKVLGINRRNLCYIYQSNPRKYFPIADDKVLTKKYLTQANIPVPETYCVVSTMGEINYLWDNISQLNEFVIKPAKGRAGGGIIILNKSNDYWVSPSGRIYKELEVKKQMADIIFGVYSFGLWDKVLIEQRVKQHNVFNSIFSQGVADIRIIVYNHIPQMAMTRIPTAKSQGKANLHQGAIGVGVDIKSGCMTYGYNYTGYLTKHSDTGIEFKELPIPFWNEILDISKNTSYAVPLKYIGIDIVIDQKRGPLVMEINVRPGLEIQNVNRQGLREVLAKQQTCQGEKQ